MMIGNEQKLRAALIEDHLTFAGTDGILVLTEDEVDAKLRSASIHGAVSGSLLVRLHNYAPLPNMAKRDKIYGYYQKCDYALFTEVDDVPIVFFIEMKSRNVEEKEVVQQLKGGACIVDYIFGFVLRFLGIPKIDYQERYVVFYRSKAIPLPPPTRLPFSGRQCNTDPGSPIALPDPDTKRYTVQNLIRN